jgi:hypothetical protein
MVGSSPFVQEEKIIKAKKNFVKNWKQRNL